MARTSKLVWLVAGALLVAACGGGDDDAGSDPGVAPPDVGTSAESDGGTVAGGESVATDPGVGDVAGGTDAPSATGELDPSALRTDPIDLATIADVAFTPPLECPLLSYAAANGGLGKNFQAIDVTETGCVFDNGNDLDGRLEVRLLDPAGFDPASPDLIGDMDPVIVVEPQDGPGTNAVLMYDNNAVELGLADEPAYYGFAFEQDGSQVVILGDLIRFTPEQFRMAADDIATKVGSATITPATGGVVAEGPGWCSIWSGDELRAALGVSLVKGASGGTEDCSWLRGMLDEVARIDSKVFAFDPSTADTSLQVDSLGVPAAFDEFLPEYLVLDVDGQLFGIIGTTQEASVMLATNFLQRIGR